MLRTGASVASQNRRLTSLRTRLRTLLRCLRLLCACPQPSRGGSPPKSPVEGKNRSLSTSQTGSRKRMGEDTVPRAEMREGGCIEPGPCRAGIAELSGRAFAFMDGLAHLGWGRPIMLPQCTALPTSRILQNGRPTPLSSSRASSQIFAWKRWTRRSFHPMNSVHLRSRSSLKHAFRSLLTKHACGASSSQRGGRFASPTSFTRRAMLSAQQISVRCDGRQTSRVAVQLQLAFIHAKALILGSFH